MNKFNYYIALGILIILLGNYSDIPSFIPLYLNLILGGGIILYSLFERENAKQERIKYNWKKGLLTAITVLLVLIIVKMSIKHVENTNDKNERKGIIYSSDRQIEGDTINEKTEKSLDSILNSN